MPDKLSRMSPANNDSPADRYAIILDSINDGVFTVDRQWRITSFNRAAEQITGVPRNQAIGRPCCEVFRASICETACALRQTLATGRPIVNQTIYILDAQSNRIPISISTATFKDEHGEIIGGVETFRDLSLVDDLRKELEAKYSFADIVGRSATMRQVFQILPQIAESDSTVLIEGASGTGKELFARAIHNLSRRRGKRFVALNCAALPDTLLESELFGYKAAHSPMPGRTSSVDLLWRMAARCCWTRLATSPRPCRSDCCESCRNGRMNHWDRVEPVQTDVRIIAATNKDLGKLVRKGVFREDLFYRIHVIRLVLPSLRDRREDIPLLVDHFVGKFNRLQGKDVVGVSEDVLARLMEHDYPGNVRELENVIEHAFVLCRGGLIQLVHLPPELRDSAAGEAAPSIAGMTFEAMERLLIADALRRHHGNRSAAAKHLGINPSTLFRKAKTLGIELPKEDGRKK